MNLISLSASTQIDATASFKTHSDLFNKQVNSVFILPKKNVSLNIKINKIYGKGIGNFLNIPFKYHKHELSESMRGKGTDNNEPQGGNIRGQPEMPFETVQESL